MLGYDILALLSTFRIFIDITAIFEEAVVSCFFGFRASAASVDEGKRVQRSTTLDLEVG
jgi:hypothetical protein